MIYGCDVSDRAPGSLRKFRSDLNGAKKAIGWVNDSHNRRLYIMRTRRFSVRSYNILRKAGRFNSFLDYCLDLLESEGRRVSAEDVRRIYFG